MSFLATVLNAVNKVHKLNLTVKTPAKKSLKN